VKIRLAIAAPGDEQVIAALLAELDEFYGGQPEGAPEQRAAQVRGVLFVGAPAANALLAWDGATLAGFASWSLLWPAAGLTASLYLKELYVAASHRRSGVATDLMDELHRIAAARGCSRVEWTTDTDNPSAQAFYEARGAKPKVSKIFYRVDGNLPGRS
jgi:GNAT superfamily N-acetyltransferase